jgi:C-terminal processing protease CtpA/Prc
MLAALPFLIEGKYYLMIPIADFFTYDGVRLDKNGVFPNFEVKSEDALEKTIEIINKKWNYK